MRRLNYKLSYPCTFPKHSPVDYLACSFALHGGYPPKLSHYSSNMAFSPWNEGAWGKWGWMAKRGHLEDTCMMSLRPCLCLPQKMLRVLSEKVSVSRERVSGFPENGADLRGSQGNFRGSLGNFRGSLGNFRGTAELLLSSTARELPGKSPKNFRGSLGNFRGSWGTSQKLGGAWLPSSDSPNLSPILTSKPNNCISYEVRFRKEKGT